MLLPAASPVSPSVRGRPRSAVVPGEHRWPYTVIREVESTRRRDGRTIERRVLVSCSRCGRNVVVELYTFRMERVPDPRWRCNHRSHLGIATKPRPIVVPASSAPVGVRMRGAIEDLADVGETRGSALLAVAGELRARARDLRASPGGMWQARVSEGLARIAEYLAEDPQLARAVVRGGR